VYERERKKEGKECAQNQYTGQFEHTPHPLSLFLSLFLIQRSQNLSLFLSVPIAQLVKAWRGVFFQAVLSSIPSQVKNLSFKDNYLDSEIFIAYQCWDWNGDLRDCNGEYRDWNFNPCKISKNPCIIKIGIVRFRFTWGRIAKRKSERGWGVYSNWPVYWFWAHSLILFLSLSLIHTWDTYPIKKVLKKNLSPSGFELTSLLNKCYLKKTKLFV